VKISNYVLVLVFLVFLFSCSKKEETTQEKPSRLLDVSKVTTVVTVKEINLAERLLTLDYGDGNELVVKSAEDVMGLENIQVGDKVKVTYIRSQAVYVTVPGAEVPPMASNRTVEIDSKEGTPKTLTIKVKEDKSTVEAIDYEKRTAVLRHEDGTLENIDVSPELKNLENVKVGDLVVLQVTEAVAVDITKVEN
jgi:hypothetical protein